MQEKGVSRGETMRGGEKQDARMVEKVTIVEMLPPSPSRAPRFQFLPCPPPLLLFLASPSSLISPLASSLSTHGHLVDTLDTFYLLNPAKDEPPRTPRTRPRTDRAGRRRCPRRKHPSRRGGAFPHRHHARCWAGGRPLVLRDPAPRKDDRVRCWLAPGVPWPWWIALHRRARLVISGCRPRHAVGVDLVRETCSYPSFHVDHAAALPYIMEKVCRDA